MPLNIATLTPGIQAAFASGIVPPPGQATRDEIASALSSSYNSYASAALSCAPAPPTLVNYSDLENGMKDLFGNDSATEQDAAEAWAQAHYDYWDGALFGLTGMVVLITGKPALVSTLVGIFSNKLNTLVSAAQQIAAALDAFTRTVQVQDTLLPAPPGIGCGPIPIV